MKFFPFKFPTFIFLYFFTTFLHLSLSFSKLASTSISIPWNILQLSRCGTKLNSSQSHHWSFSHVDCPARHYQIDLYIYLECTSSTHPYIHISICICTQTATAHFFGKFLALHTLLANGNWCSTRGAKGREGQTMHPISPENEDNPKSVCRLAPWQFVNQLHTSIWRI